METKDVRSEFLGKLPHVALYHVPDYESIRYRYGSQGPRDWFSFLAAADSLSKRTHADGNRECEFPYIQYDREEFGRIMLKVMHGASSFIDVGCGGGDKLAIIKENWPHVLVHGVEHDPAMAIWAGLCADKVFCQDALTMNYWLYDVVYAYWPIQDKTLMDKLIERILDTKHPGAKFVLVGYGYGGKRKDVDYITGLRSTGNHLRTFKGDHNG